jgi:dihydrofolate reductase
MATEFFPDDTVLYRIQILVNKYHGKHMGPPTKKALQAELNSTIPVYCANNLVIEEDEALEAHGAIRVLCEVRGEKRSYEVFAAEQDKMPIWPPLTVEELAASNAAWEAIRKPPAKVVMIVAISENNVIGKDGGLPWHIPNDLKFFKDQTMGQPLVVGRRTYNSMPAFVWKTRHANVLTHDIDSVKMPGAGHWHVGTDLASMVHMATVNYNADTVFIAGGAQVYVEALKLDLVDELLISHIKGNFEGGRTLHIDPEFLGFEPGVVELEDPEFTVKRYIRKRANNFGAKRAR